MFGELFEWKNKSGLVSKCWLRTEDFEGYRVHVATEMAGNTGQSITNGAEILWKKVQDERGAGMFVECYNRYSYPEGVYFGPAKLAEWIRDGDMGGFRPLTKRVLHDALVEQDEGMCGSMERFKDFLASPDRVVCVEDIRGE